MNLIANPYNFTQSGNGDIISKLYFQYILDKKNINSNNIYTLDCNDCKNGNKRFEYCTVAENKDSTFHNCLSCNNFFHHSAEGCIPNVCHCPNGQHPTGSACAINGDLKCVGCNAGYKLETKQGATVCTVCFTKLGRC